MENNGGNHDDKPEMVTLGITDTFFITAMDQMDLARHIAGRAPELAVSLNRMAWKCAIENLVTNGEALSYPFSNSKIYEAAGLIEQIAHKRWDSALGTPNNKAFCSGVYIREHEIPFHSLFK